MAFIPGNTVFCPAVGDRVRLKRDVRVGAGTFTKGHELTVISIGERGPNLVDDDGHYLTEMGMSLDALEPVKS